mgnify:CR=1 FL=1
MATDKDEYTKFERESDFPTKVKYSEMLGKATTAAVTNGIVKIDVSERDRFQKMADDLDLEAE